MSLERIEAAVLAVLKMESYKPGLGTLWDLRSADVSRMTSEDLRRMRSSRAQLRDRRGHSRVALLADSDLTFGIARMSGTIAELPGLPIGVFRTEAEAIVWLGGVEQNTRDGSTGPPAQ